MGVRHDLMKALMVILCNSNCSSELFLRHEHKRMEAKVGGEMGRMYHHAYKGNNIGTVEVRGRPRYAPWYALRTSEILFEIGQTYLLSSVHVRPKDVLVLGPQESKVLLEGVRRPESGYWGSFCPGSMHYWQQVPAQHAPWIRLSVPLGS